MSAGPVEVLVQDALNEIARLPTDAARELVRRLADIGGRPGTTAVIGVEDTVTASDAASAELATAKFGFAGDAAWTPPALKRALDNPDARAVLLNVASNALYDALKFGLTLYAGAKLATAASGHGPLVELNFYVTAPPAAQVDAAPQPTSPPPNACLPEKPTK